MTTGNKFSSISDIMEWLTKRAPESQVYDGCWNNALAADLAGGSGSRLRGHDFVIVSHIVTALIARSSGSLERSAELPPISDLLTWLDENDQDRRSDSNDCWLVAAELAQAFDIQLYGEQPKADDFRVFARILAALLTLYSQSHES